MSKVLSVDIEKCTGCRSCELACSMKHYSEYNPCKSMVRAIIFPKEAYAVPVVCPQCEEAWCEKICPTGAIRTTTDAGSGAKIVELSREKCVGCKMCVLVCPFGNILLTDDGYAAKCDLCGGDPECVKVCAAGALGFEEPEAAMMSKRKALSELVLATLVIKKEEA